MKADIEESCVFCRIVRDQVTPGVLAYRDEHTVAFPCLHQQPRNQGHMLVMPARHVGRIYDVGPDLAGPLMSTLARVATAVKQVWSADGVSIRQNNDPQGGRASSTFIST